MTQVMMQYSCFRYSKLSYVQSSPTSACTYLHLRIWKSEKSFSYNFKRQLYGTNEYFTNFRRMVYLSKIHKER